MAFLAACLARSGSASTACRRSRMASCADVAAALDARDVWLALEASRNVTDGCKPKRLATPLTAPKVLPMTMAAAFLDIPRTSMRSVSLSTSASVHDVRTFALDFLITRICVLSC